MNIYKCPNCKNFISTKEIYRGINYRWPWITKVKCKKCGVKLSQKWPTMIFAWFVFGFLVYVSIYKGGIWFVYSAILFLFLLFLGFTGKIFEIDDEENA